MTEQMALILLGVLTVVLSVLMTRTARTVYRKTGVNPISGVHKFLWYVEMLPLSYGLTALADGSGIAVILGCVVVFSALHTLLSMKAGLSNAILMGVLQGVAGGLAALLNVFVLVANVALKTNIRLFSMDVPKAAPVRQDPAERQERAEAAAWKAGFASADEAEYAGLDTGAYYR